MSLLHIIAGHLNCFMMNLRKLIIFFGQRPFPDVTRKCRSLRVRKLNHRIYYVTTKDFNTFSETKLFFNPDFSVIDAAIVRDPVMKDLIMVVKNENSLPAEKNLRITRTTRIEDGFPTTVSPSITGDYWCEGPAPLFVDDVLYVYFDKYRNHQYGAVCSRDHGKTWEDVSDRVSFPKGIRHGTAFTVEKAVLDKLLRIHNLILLFRIILLILLYPNLVILIIFMVLLILIKGCHKQVLLWYGNLKIL